MPGSTPILSRGFQYLRARYYDPATDQFISVDPLVGFTQQPYGYSPGDPLDSVDPYGLFCISSLCSDSVTNAAGSAFGFIGQNASTIVPVAIYVGAVGGMALCAFVTAGLCIGADVAAGGALFGGGTLLTYALLPPGEGPAPEDAGAALPVGRKGCPISVFDDVDTDVNGRMYSGHAVARMQGRGFTPTVVDNVLARGTFMGVSEGKDVYYDSENNITVLTNGEGKVVSVGYGKFKVRP